ncbi:Galactokinase [Candidatus Moduliflexus flocculans]|uniref:Galactokinase n=1 Tax=Candidatus Moduliflexus flocculans TaxID=1499966 RepID=A0A081BPV9_9BACT|nr:Galactokinase [Candidatus Moduliflexus flocculans]
MKHEAIERIASTYQQKFGQAPELIVSAPGRVNLIGEHTDYNDGFVLPVAIDRKIIIGGSKRNDDTVRIYSLNFEEFQEFSLASLIKQNTWSDYVKGVISELQQEGHRVGGFNAVMEGNVPRASGLSSSAALEVASAFFIAQFYGIQMSGEAMAKLCQRAENRFVGVNCGIMDQFISRLGKAGHALMIDCRDLGYQLVPFDLKGYSIVMCNSKVKRQLVDSAYNERRSQCEEGVRLLQAKLPNITALRDVTSAQLEEYTSLLPPLTYRRCRHVVTEDERVQQAVQALQAGNLSQFGALLNQSHESLKDDYEVSCKELDILVELARSVSGTIGSRMTGAGFGGCTVSIVKDEAVEEFRKSVMEGYTKRTGITAEIYISKAEDGARVETI